jgi:hypothetical protein
LSSQNSFGAGQEAFHALVAPASRTQGAGESFEERLNFVVIGAAVERADVNIAARAASEAFEEIVDEFGLQVANEARANFGVDDGGSAAAEVDGGEAESFVHGHDEISGAENATFRAERLLEGLAERDADILDGVVLIDIEVALGVKSEVEAAVVGEEFEHVIEKANAGRDGITAAAINGEREINLRLFGVAMDGGFSGRCSRDCFHGKDAPCSDGLSGWGAAMLRSAIVSCKTLNK